MKKNPISKEGFEAWRHGLKPLTSIDKTWIIGRTKIHFEQRLKSNAMGRFGGGWNWKLGVQIAKGDAVVSLLVATLRIIRLPLCRECGEPVDYPRKFEWQGGEYCVWHRECWEAMQ